MINSYTEALMNQGFSEEEATAIYMRDFAPAPAAAPAPAPAPVKSPIPILRRDYETLMTPIQARDLTGTRFGHRVGFYTLRGRFPGDAPESGIYTQGYLPSPPPDPRYPRRAPVAPAPAARTVTRRRPVVRRTAPAPAPVAVMQPNPAPQSVQPRIDYEAMDFLRRGGQPVVEERDDDKAAIAFDRLTEMVDTLDYGDLTGIGDYGVDLTNPEHVPAEFPTVSQSDLNRLALRYGVGGTAMLTPHIAASFEGAAAPLTGEIVYPLTTVRPVATNGGPIIDIQPIPSGYLPGPSGIPYVPPTGYIQGPGALPVAPRPPVIGPTSGGAAKALPQPTSFMQLQQTTPPPAVRMQPQKPAPRKRGRPRKQRTDNPLPGVKIKR